MRRAHSAFVGMTLPALVVVVLDWAFWGLRNEQLGWGVHIDVLALLAAFAVALAFGGMEDDARERPSQFDALLFRLSFASFALIPAAAAGATFAYLRLDSVELGQLVALPMGPKSLMVAVVLVVTPGLTWLLREAVLHLGHAPRCLLAVGALGVAGWGVTRESGSGERLEYLKASFVTAASLPAMTLDVESQHVKVVDDSFEYLAVGNNCVFRPTKPLPNARIATQSVAIPRSGSSAGFAVCPAIDIYRANGQIHGLDSEHPRQKPLFRIDGARLVNSNPTTSLYQQEVTTILAGQKLATVGPVRAPRATTSDKDSGDGIVIVRQASDLLRCKITALERDRVLFEQDTAVANGQTKLVLCGSISVSRSPKLDIVALDAPGGDFGTGSIDAASRLWHAGEVVERLPLREVRSHVRVPKSWRVGAAAGVAIGWLGLVVVVVELVRARKLRGFAPAHHEGGGKVVLEHDGIVDVESAAGLDAGEVYVRGVAPPARKPGYREPAQVRSATLEVRAPSALDGERLLRSARVTFASALALAFPIATSALLLAARLFGLEP